MNSPWLKTVFPIAAIFSFRMLGLFLLIPVFSVYAAYLEGATPALIGLALGGYGLSQGLLQMPFGMLSDRLGRKPILTIGLLFFVAGSLLGAITHSIYGMIMARVLQGTGAIGSVLIALLADLTRDDQRTKAMAVIGMTIGTSFSLAMVLSPLIAARFGLSGIFYFTAVLAGFGLLILHLIIPQPTKECFHVDSEASLALIGSVVKNKPLQKLNVSIFCQHFILTSTFFALPLLLNHHVQSGHLTQQWHFYLPLMFFSFVLMVPFIVLAEKKKKIKAVFISSVSVTFMTQWFLAYMGQHWWGLCLLMFVYFVAFNILEALLPSLVSRQANSGTKGTAMGVYSTSQFLGLFTGGALAGVLYQWHGEQAIFLTNTLLSGFWGVISFYLKPNVYLLTLSIAYHHIPLSSTDMIKSILCLEGVVEALDSQEENVLYVRVDKASYIEGSVERLLASSRKIAF